MSTPPTALRSRQRFLCSGYRDFLTQARAADESVVLLRHLVLQLAIYWRIRVPRIRSIALDYGKHVLRSIRDAIKSLRTLDIIRLEPL
jgi:hypothetical protein